LTDNLHEFFGELISWIQRGIETMFVNISTEDCDTLFEIGTNILEDWVLEREMQFSGGDILEGLVLDNGFEEGFVSLITGWIDGEKAYFIFGLI